MARIVKKPEIRKKEIIDAVIQIFREGGEEHVSMQQVMDRLNIAKGTIYHYFSSKEALLEEVIECLVNDELQQMEQIIQEEAFKDKGALEKMRLLLTRPSISKENENVLNSLHKPEYMLVHARQLGNYILKIAPLYADIIHQGCREGVFSTDHPLECAEFLLAGAQFLSDLGFYPWSQEDLYRRAAALPGIIEKNLGAPEGSFSFIQNADPT